MKFSLSFLCIALLYLVQYKPIGVYSADGSGHQLNTDNEFYKKWSFTFINNYSVFIKKFAEICSKTLKDLKSHHNAAVYKNEIKELENIIELYNQMDKLKDAIEKLRLICKIRFIMRKDMIRYEKPENKNHPVLLLLKKHGAKELAEEGRKNAEKYFNELIEAFDNYVTDLNDEEVIAHQELIDWVKTFKAIDTIDEKCKIFNTFFTYFDPVMESYIKNV